ncbi:MFS transporter [Roseicyclus marinus]|uniref:MFS transporter n=1 Tax=Roseicyclus marinus TaxID=2161673 RepID=UPI00240F86DA|nr:MFS transporter [Roseicyclus marinus]MDG3041203.1 MFS transporter [Roseicyclus marinus]
MSSVVPEPAVLTQDALRAARRRIHGWWAFDWASQPYFTLGLTFIFGPYFAAVATEAFMAQGLAEQVADARAQSLWSLGQTVAGVIIALCAPILGAFADNTGRRMPWIVLFSLFYVLGAAAMWYTLPDGSFLIGALIAFGIGLIGAEFTTIFTNSMLPELGDESAIGTLSGNGFAWGYLGGVVALFVMLIFFAEGESGRTFVGLEPALGLDPEAREGTRFVGPFIAIWYVVFMIPFFLWVREPRRAATHASFGAALGDLWGTVKSLPGRVSLFAYLGSSMFYRDALNALYGFGGTYAVLVLNWSVTQVGIFGIIGAVTSALATWLGGKADSALGPKPVIVGAIVTLIAVCAVILGMSRESLWGIALAEGSGVPDVVFYICGAIIGGAGGVLQSASRSMMCRHAPPTRPTEAFGLYALSGKATAFLGPALIGLTTWATESARLGMAPLIGLFVVGLVLLVWVRPEGEKA